MKDDLLKMLEKFHDEIVKEPRVIDVINKNKNLLVLSENIKLISNIMNKQKIQAV